LLNMLKEYIDKPKEIIIPITIAGLFSAEPKSIILAENAREIIYDEILCKLPNDVKRIISGMDKGKSWTKENEIPNNSLL